MPPESTLPGAIALMLLALALPTPVQALTLAVVVGGGVVDRYVHEAAAVTEPV